MLFLSKFLSSKLVTVILIFVIAAGAFWYIKDAEKKKCENASLEAVIKESEEARRDRENSERIVRDADNIDSLLDSIGILRTD